MPVYAVNSKEQGMAGTGIVDVVNEWEDGPNGKRRPSKEQAKHVESGLPVWNVECLYRTTHFGRPMSVTPMVQVPSATRPEITPMTPIEFEGLRVEVRAKGTGFEERWTANAIVGAAKSGRAQSGQ